MIDLQRARAAAHAIAEETLGQSPGRMKSVASRSHQVFVSSTVVVKLINAADHSRLDREISLALHLPAGLSAPVLASGRYRIEAEDVRYLCVARLPGASPGMGLPGVDRATACRWARQAVSQLQRLHDWVPPDPAAATLHEHLDHGGFVGRSKLQAEITRVRDLNHEALVPQLILDGLDIIAARASEHVEALDPVHADCHWGNWLVHDQSVTALLDFEWARFGEPVDDWMFLSRFSGPHMLPVLEVIAEATATPLDALKTACELREAAHLAFDLRLALQDPHRHAQEVAQCIHDLAELVINRCWW